MSDCRKNDSRGSIVSGIIVLGVGLLFLGVNMDILPSMSQSWPVFLVIVGVALIVGNLLKKRASDQDQAPPPPSH